MITVFHGTIEDFIKSIRVMQPIFLTASEKQTENFSHFSVLLTSADPEQDIVHVFMVRTGRQFRLPSGAPGWEGETTTGYTMKILNRIRDFLKDSLGIEVMDGMVSFPSDIELLSGWDDILNDVKRDDKKEA